MRSMSILTTLTIVIAATFNNGFLLVHSFVLTQPKISSHQQFGSNKGAFVRKGETINFKSKLIVQSSETPTAEESKVATEIPEEWRGEVLSTLSNIIDPDLNRDIVTLGFIKDLSLDSSTRTVSFSVELTTPACPVKEEFQSQCEELVMKLPWTSDTKVTMTAADPTPDTSGAPYGLSGVSSIIAVSSCKGGVGKSTTAVNLAYALQTLGAKVGIFDADVYGPSLPTMIKPDNDNVQFVGRQIAPLQRNGVSLMSFGYVNEGAAIMRGPMITQLLDQILSMTYWGQLDYLILDMPPGTGDIQLTLSQRLNITAAVIVTTPQELSFVDVERGVDMFQEVNVPCVAVVENMAYIDMDEQKSQKSQKNSNLIDTESLKQSFLETIQTKMSPLDPAKTNDLVNELVTIVQNQQQNEEFSETDSIDIGSTDGKSSQLRIFGPGHKRRLSSQWGIEHTFSIPLVQNIAQTGDSGTPFILQHPDSPQADVFYDLASSVVMEVSKINYSNANSIPSFHYNQENHMIEVKDPLDNESAATNVIPSDLRRECKCAECVEELTGRQLLNPLDVSDLVKPITMKPCGNYALSVDWSDGHRSLYPYKQIRSFIHEKREEISEEVSI